MSYDKKEIDRVISKPVRKEVYIQDYVNAAESLKGLIAYRLSISYFFIIENPDDRQKALHWLSVAALNHRYVPALLTAAMFPLVYLSQLRNEALEDEARVLSKKSIGHLVEYYRLKPLEDDGEVDYIQGLFRTEQLPDFSWANSIRFTKIRERAAIDEALSLFSLAIQKGNSKALLQICALSEILGVKKAKNIWLRTGFNAKNYLKDSFYQGDKKAGDYFINLYYSKKQLEFIRQGKKTKDDEEARIIVQSLADDGLMNAQYLLGVLSFGDGDEENALFYFKKAEIQNHHQAQISLARMIEYRINIQWDEWIINENQKSQPFWMQTRSKLLDMFCLYEKALINHNISEDYLNIKYQEFIDKGAEISRAPIRDKANEEVQLSNLRISHMLASKNPSSIYRCVF